MKKIILFAIAAVFALSFSSCDDYLDDTDYTASNSGNFPQNVTDLNKEVAALYGVMNQFNTNPLTSYFYANVILSDDCNGAGGDGDTESHALGHIMATTNDYYASAWHAAYVGIARANAIIATDEGIMSSMDETTKNQLLGEAYFMRGLYYMWATQMWGDIPAYWEASAPTPCPQQSAEDVIYPHILADFMSAYNLMTYGATTQGDGHATKGAAGGYLARAYMFYEGFYKHVGELATATPEAVTLPEQQGVTNTSLSKSDVVTILNEVIASNRYSLINDYRRLWSYSNESTAQDYSYVADLKSAGQYWAGNGNAEEMFQIQFGNFASWNGTIGMGFTNMTSLYSSLRCDAAADNATDPHTGSTYVNGTLSTFPYAQGWGQGTINANLWDEWPDSDPRKRATILNVDDELEHYSYTTSCTEDAGLYNKKLCEITTKASSQNDMTSGPYTFWSEIREANGAQQNNGNCMQGDHFTDIVLMRYADILLMQSELTGDATQMNNVRARVGLPALAYTLENIQNERRWEFAGEGIRFNDLRRWSGKNGGQSCLAATALQKQNGTRVNYKGNWTTMHHAASSWAQRYAETDGFLPIPSSQINIVNDSAVLKQNPGWGDDVSDWNMTTAPAY